jgi:hypothetical protein
VFFIPRLELMQMKKGRCFVLLLVLLSAFVTTSNLALWGAPVDTRTLSFPILFERNLGQAPPAYRYVSRHGSIETLFSPAFIDFVTRTAEGPKIIHLRLLGSRADVSPEGRKPLGSVTNYLIGNDPARWLRGVSNDSEVVYPRIYPGIELAFHGNGDLMEHDFRIAPGADPTVVRFVLEGAGAQNVSLDSAGNLSFLSAGGVNLVFKRPVAYQESASGRERVDAQFAIGADHSVRFHVGAYDHKRELVIDPVFQFSTYLASSSYDIPAAVTTDSAGNIYVAGYSGPGFPIVNGIQATIAGSEDAYIAKLDPTGHTLLYSTYLGGSQANYPGAIAIDGGGNIIVAGTSSSNDFPHAGAVPPLTCEGNNSCYFISSLTPDGSQFNYSGLIGGIEGIYAPNQGRLAVDAAGNAYLAGITDDSHFKITKGTLATSVPGYPYDSTFVMKVAPTGALSYSTIIPGTAPQNPAPYQNVFFPAGIAVDSNGQATIAGMAGLGLPSTAGVIQPTFPNDPNAENASAGFALQLNDKASAINYATYVPGTDTIGGLAVDSSGNLYVTGATSETNLPVSANAYQKTIKAGQYCTCNSGFIAKLNGTGTAVLAATYLEGTPATGNEGTAFTGIALDSQSNVFVGGMTGSTDFPLVNPFVSLWVYGESAWDMVLAEMSPDLSSLLFGSFLSSVDQVFAAPQFSAIAVGQAGNLLVAGSTNTTDFPTTAGSFQQTPPNQANHGFVADLIMSTPAPSACIDSWSVNFGSVLVNTSNTQTIHLTNCGNATLHLTSVVSSSATVAATNTCATISSGGVCAVSLAYRPRDTSGVSGTLTFNDDTAIAPQVISYFGQGIAPQLSPSSGSINFGHLLVNTKDGINTLFFFNAGTAPLTFKSVSADGDFSISRKTCTGTVGIYSGCFIGVTFGPTAAGIRTGTLTIVSNDPVNPREGFSLVGIGDSVYAQPVIMALDSPTAQIQNGPITIHVTGANFYPASIVQANGIAQPTTFTDSGDLQATLSGSAAAQIGEIQITVSNPLPGGGSSSALPLTGFAVLNLSAASLASAPSAKFVYASMPAWSSTNPNTVLPIDAETGNLGTPIAVGNDPGLIALTSDGKYLFVVANQDQTVQRINLSKNSVEKIFNFPPNNCSYCGLQTAVDLKAIPGSPENFVLALTGEVALYNSHGLVNYVPTTYSAFGDFTSFAFAGHPSTIYTLPFTNAQSDFFNIITINASGLSFTLPEVYGVNATTGAQVVSDGTLLYTSAGEVWNPATQTQTGSFPITILNASSLPNLDSMVMDTSSGHIFTIGDQSYQSYSFSMFLSAYGKRSLALTGSLAFPTIPQPYAQNLVRCGLNGFAFIAEAPNGNSEDVYLLASSLAAAAGPNPVPGITSLSSSSASAGSAGFELTLNGQGFTETSVVTWNGVPLQTTYSANSVLTASVPATYLASSGSISVTVKNPAPGGGKSNVVQFVVTPPTPLISFSSATATFPSQKVGTRRTQVIAVQNPGTATLNISAVQITGANASSFRQTNNCGSVLAAGANCSLSLIFAPKTTGTFSATVAFTDNASGSPQSISLSGTGD